MARLKSGWPFALFAALVLCAESAAWAEWVEDGVAICNATGEQLNPTVVSDGAGGAIVAWEDRRDGNWDIYAQRIEASGMFQWMASGVAMCTSTGDQRHPTAASDGAGGAIITWYDGRSGNSNIYAQRVDAQGIAQWMADGVALCASTAYQEYPTIVSDGAGGAIVTWHDSRNGLSDIYAQRVDASGATLWTTDGVPLCTATSTQYFPEIISDDAGGAIVIWQDTRRAGIAHADIYAQRVGVSGIPLWTIDGVVLCTTAWHILCPAITADGEGGAIVVWHDPHDIYGQRVDASGTVQWTADGVALCAAATDQEYPEIISDGVGGAIVTWQDGRNGRDDIFAQRVDASGTVQWVADGVALCTAAWDQLYPTIVSDGAGGGIVAWFDRRNGTGNDDIFAQRVDASGTVQWTADGVALCTASRDQWYPKAVSDGAGGAIVTWEDERSDSNFDIFAQRVTHLGTVGNDPVQLSMFAVIVIAIILGSLGLVMLRTKARASG